MNILINSHQNLGVSEWNPSWSGMTWSSWTPSYILREGFLPAASLRMTAILGTEAKCDYHMEYSKVFLVSWFAFHPVFSFSIRSIHLDIFSPYHPYAAMSLFCHRSRFWGVLTWNIKCKVFVEGGARARPRVHNVAHFNYTWNNLTEWWSRLLNT